jgi:hypothetical protein
MRTLPFCAWELRYKAAGLAVLFILKYFMIYGQAIMPLSAATTHPQVNLFLHLDKSIYLRQETIWFTGYVLNRDETLMREQNTLFVVLVDPVNKSVVMKNRFLIKNGIGKGFILLPDTLAGGDYWFIAYTNAMLQTGDQPVFRELISIRTNDPSPFRISSNRLLQGADSIRIKYKISTSYGGLAAGGFFNYTLFDSIRAIKSGVEKIDPFGEVTIPIGSIKDTGKYRELAVQITRDGISKKVIFPVYQGKALSQKGQMTPLIPVPAPDVKIVSDSLQYHQHSKVKLTIQIRDSAGNPLAGIFSMAVTASKRIRSGNVKSIVESERSPQLRVTDSAISSLKNLSGQIADFGYVLRDNNPVRRPVKLVLLGENFASFQTDSSGIFVLPYAAMIASPGSSNYVSVSERSPELYKIMVYSRADTFDHQLAVIHYPLGTVDSEPSLDPDDLAFQASSRTLKAAVVRGKRKHEANILSGEYNSIHCDQDYVCTHNHGSNGTLPPHFLNCPYLDRMPPCTLEKPLEGALYLYTPKEASYARATGAAVVTYHCAVPPMPSFMKALDPILTSKPFPISPPPVAGHQAQESDLQSTVYWNHALVTDTLGRLSVTFYANDLTGNFTCTLQGVSAAGVLFSQATYAVVGNGSITTPKIEGATSAQQLSK